MVISLNGQGQLCQYFVQEEETFQTTPKWAWFSQGDRQNGKEKTMQSWPENLDENLVPLTTTTHTSFHLILYDQKTFPKNFCHQNEAFLVNTQQKKKMGQEKQQERRGEKALLLHILKLQFSKLIVCYWNRTKATKCTTCERLFIGRF